MMRYLPITDADRLVMLEAIGVPSVEALFADVPQDALLAEPLGLPPHASEYEVEKRLSRLAAQNRPAGAGPFFCGAGTYRHHIPAAVDHLIQRGEFLTSYTPYQPEIAQGTLQYLFEFQTQVCLLTGMEVANASMYDGATATAEAVMMANRVTRRSKALASGNLHPHYRDTAATLARYQGFTLDCAPPRPLGAEELAARIDTETSCVVVQYPDLFGNIADYSDLAEAAHAKGALLVMVVTEIVALGALRPPGDMGADIVAAEGQSLGNPMSFGGPHLGLFAARMSNVRQMPGRLCGETVDVEGRRGYVLTLVAREQHIRRQRATSNICTNSGLCALAFTIHLTLLGETGLKRLASLNHTRAVQLADRLGQRVITPYLFNEFTVRLDGDAAATVERLAGEGIIAGVPVSRLHAGAGLDNLLLVAVTETTDESDLTVLAEALA